MKSGSPAQARKVAAPPGSGNRVCRSFSTRVSILRDAPGGGESGLIHALDILPALRAARRRAGHLLAAVDYDGTLTPIVAHPAAARLAPAARDVIARLALRADTWVAVLSGRALADVQERLGLPGLYYAGNHGLEISGPGLEWVHPGARAALPALRAAAAELREELRTVAGAEVEDKGVSLSVHYRRVAPAARPGVRDVALRTGCGRAGVRCTEGKLAVELRPDVAWHKGEALRFIRGSLPGGEACPALFLGDDRTDEDAFRVLAGEDCGVVVAAEPPAGTAAGAYLASPREVIAFLAGLLPDADG